MNYIIN